MITATGTNEIVLRNLRDRTGLSQRQIAKISAARGHYISQASISLMEAGKAPVSAEYESLLRILAGERVVTVPPCRACGQIHVGECNGNGGVTVVLSEGERVVRRGKGRKENRVRWSATPDQDARCAALGVTRRAVIEAGLWALAQDVAGEIAALRALEIDATGEIAGLRDRLLVKALEDAMIASNALLHERDQLRAQLETAREMQGTLPSGAMRVIIDVARQAHPKIQRLREMCAEVEAWLDIWELHEPTEVQP